jgi:hypothetical protein
MAFILDSTAWVVEEDLVHCIKTTLFSFAIDYLDSSTPKHLLQQEHCFTNLQVYACCVNLTVTDPM